MLTPSFIPFPTLETERLTLRQIEESDASEIFFLRSDPVVLKYLDRAPATSIEEAIGHIRKSRADEALGDCVTWGLVPKGDSRVIGTICIWHIRKQHYRAEVGYVLRPEYHGRGYMNETMTAVLAYGFRKMKLHSMDAIVNPANTDSIRLLERHGFVREGYFREDYFWDGRFLDTAVYSRLER